MGCNGAVCVNGQPREDSYLIFVPIITFFSLNINLSCVIYRAYDVRNFTETVIIKLFSFLFQVSDRLEYAFYY